jgi:signal transduction histidine kinase
MSLFRFSLTFKITFFYFLLITVSLCLISFAIIFSSQNYFINEAQKTVENDFTVVSNYLFNNQDNFSGETLENYITSNNEVIIQKDGETLFEKSSKESSINLDPKYELQIFNSEITFTKEIFVENNKYDVFINNYFNSQRIMLNIIAWVLIVVNSIVILLIIFLGIKINKKMFSPIKTMITSVKNISGSNLEERIDVGKSYDELKDLGETFNQMLDRIHRSYEQQKRFVNDASHELRTPIAVIQGYANMLDRWGKDDPKILEESIDAIKDESESMKKLVTSLLFLARADKETQTIEKQPFHLDQLIEALVKETKLIDHNHEIINNNEENLIMYGDKKLLKQGIRIFIENSIKYTPDNGKISLKSFSKENSIYISVRDTGIGIPKESIEHIFERFYRADESRTKKTGGTGLGLSIAKWIIDSHQGTIEVFSEVGIGTEILIQLPYKSD